MVKQKDTNYTKLYSATQARNMDTWGYTGKALIGFVNGGKACRDNPYPYPYRGSKFSKDINTPISSKYEIFRPCGECPYFKAVATHYDVKTGDTVSVSAEYTDIEDAYTDAERLMSKAGIKRDINTKIDAFIKESLDCLTRLGAAKHESDFDNDRMGGKDSTEYYFLQGDGMEYETFYFDKKTGSIKWYDVNGYMYTGYDLLNDAKNIWRGFVNRAVKAAFFVVCSHSRRL